MKKSILFAAMFALSASMVTSCKKDYTCVCTKVYTSSSSTSTYQDDVYTFNDTRTRAERKCNDQESTGTDLYGSYSRECQIK